MVNTNKLLGLIVSKGYNQTSFSKVLGIAPLTFSRKVNNKYEFRQSEIKKMVDVLEIEDVKDIFFADQVI